MRDGLVGLQFGDQKPDQKDVLKAASLLNKEL